MTSEDAAQRVQADRMQAMQLGIRSIPTLIVSSADKTTDPIRLQTTPAELLKSRLQDMMQAA
jgi:predicted DsbA family dithiol-disulfide isomerase